MNDDEDPPVDQKVASTIADSLTRSSARGAALVGQHIDDYGEVLPHILAADVARWYSEVGSRADSSEASDAAVAVEALADLLIEGNDDIENVIATGFLEALPQPRDDSREVVERLPAPLRDELRRMENWTP